MKKIWWILFTLMSILLSSCGSANVPSTTLQIVMSDFKYEPAEFTVPAGKEITLNLKNEGAVAHEFVIMKLGQSAGEKFGPEDEDNIYWEVELDPGQSVTVTFTAPTEAGTYEVVCGTEGHLEAGMKGTLTVVSP